MTTREQIFSALFGLVSQGEGLAGNASATWVAGSGFVYTSRRVREFSDPKPQPALYQNEPHETFAQRFGEPSRRFVSAQWIIYHQAGKNASAVPSTTNNNILDAIEAALAPSTADPGFQNNLQTLGGLVTHVWIEGQLIKAPGDLDSQGLLIVPLKLLLP